MNGIDVTASERPLVPHKLHIAGNRRLVHWADPTKLDIRFGFFRDSIATLPDVAKHARLTTLDSVQKTDIDPDLATRCKGLIFHCARCGSTLLCQMLKQHPNLLVVGEPTIIGELLRDPTLTKDQRHSSLIEVFDASLRWAQHEQKFVVFKLSSWQLHHWRDLVCQSRGFGQAPFRPDYSSIEK